MKAAAVAVVRYVFPVIGKLVPAAKLGVSETVSSLALTTRTQRSTLLLGVDPVWFDHQMADIEREWLLINSVFRPRMVEALRSDGSQRTPEEIWREISKSG